jgi:hypothetical protein
MGCRWCKFWVGALVTIILASIVALIMSSFGGAAGLFTAWTGAISKLAGVLGIVGKEAIRTLGYEVFSLIIGAGAYIVYLLADIIDWLLCLICSMWGDCEDCKKPF